MATHVQGSFYTEQAFTVRMTVGASTADWVVSAGTTYATADAALAAWNTALASISASVSRGGTASTHRQSVRVDSGGPTFSITWSHAGDGTRMRDYLGEVGDLSGESSGYVFDNALAAAWFPTYDLRRLSISGAPWSKQRMMTGAGAVVTNNPHHGLDDDLMYEARAEFWFGSSTTYEGYEALRDLIDGILEHGQPFTITTDDNAYVCRLPSGDTLDLIPEPVDDVERGYIYRVTLPVVVVG